MMQLFEAGWTDLVIRNTRNPKGYNEKFEPQVLRWIISQLVSFLAPYQSKHARNVAGGYENLMSKKLFNRNI